MRQFNSQQRWRDFLDAFIKVTRKVEELKIDAFVMAGDIFHKYRPHPGVVRRFIQEIANIDCPIIMIRGNHDSPQILFEKYGGDILHLVRDVSKTVYLNNRNPTYELQNTCFIGLGYLGFNASREIANLIRSIKTKAENKIGVFHQLLDYPGVPEAMADVSRSFLMGLGLSYTLMGHYHQAYSENSLFNPGSPEYWAFDQAEQIEVNLDNGKESFKPPKKRGFIIIETDNGKSKFIELKPARPMFCITYETDTFNETIHRPMIKEHLAKYNIEGAMVKTVIRGRHKLGRMNLSKSMNLEKPLIQTTALKLTPSNVLPNELNLIKAQVQYLNERGFNNAEAQKISEWLENSKEKLAAMSSSEILHALRAVLAKEKSGE